ncbi:MAG: lytic transglycosylase domain-containing protein [Alteraurantiacibacter sp. bin_em_oilr2.035]|nr:lytic transglycosylase domain-containing protein [Alteraurantiacibacter sp. bin_em_oilr2.035]
MQANGQSRAVQTREASIDIAAHVGEASQRFGIPEHWIYAVIRIESAGRTRAVSSAGAMGLMQLMPGTWARQRVRYSLGGDPFDPRNNILAGTSYLREMYDRYGAAGFLAAYNAGPGRYEDWLAGRRSLPLETRRYVAKIAPQLQPGRIFVAAGSHSADAPGPLAEPVPTSDYAPGDPGLPETSGNAFARPVWPAHDLFAPVSTVADQ